AQRSGGQSHLAQAEQQRGEKKRKNKIEKTEDQKRRQQSLFLEQRQSDEHRGFKYPQTAGGMAEESQKRRGHEDDEQRNEIDGWLIRQQHVYRQRPHGEIKNPDSDLHDGQAQTRQDNPPMGAPDDARSRHEPDQIADNEHQPR